MKKELLIVSLVAATSVFALDSTTFSLLPVSPFYSTEDGKKLMLVSAPFDGYGSGEIKVAEVLLTDSLAEGDVMYVPTGTKGQYNQYTLAAGKETWTANKVVTIDASGAPVVGSSDSATEATISRGKPFWLKTAASSVKLLGQMPASQASTSVSTTAGAYTLVAPTTSESPVALTGESAIGKNGDRILFANGRTLYKYNGAWVQQKPTRASLSESETIPAGVGFWYMSADGSSVTL